MPEQEGPAARPDEPMWKRIGPTLFWTVLMGGGLWLALGGMPGWLEHGFVALLWTLVVLFLLGSAAALLVPEQFDVRREPSEEYLAQWKPPGLERRLLRLTRRLFLVALVGSLIAAGRPILAGLYIVLPFLLTAFQVRVAHRKYGLEMADVGAGRWVLYRSVRLVLRAPYQALLFAGRLAKWLLWIPLAGAVLACLSHADVRVVQRLRKALGVPRTLAYLIYAQPYRRFLRKVAPTGFWLVAAAFAVALAMDGLSPAVAAATAIVLWAAALGLSVVAIVSFIALVYFEEDDFSWGKPTTDWPRKTGPYLSILLRLFFLGALCAAGEWVLAGLYLSLICMVAAIALYGTFDDDWAEHPPANPFPMVSGVLGFGILLVPVVVVASPILLPYFAFKVCSDFRTARRLRGAFKRPRGLVYFLYAEPHQREHFLGPEGILKPLGCRVVARDWREDTVADLRAVGGTDCDNAPERRLLERFEITNQRGDLPFVALVGPGGRVKPFKLSKAYRARLRDGGKALGKIEGRLRAALAKAFPAPHSPPSTGPG